MTLPSTLMVGRVPCVGGCLPSIYQLYKLSSSTYRWLKRTQDNKHLA